MRIKLTVFDRKNNWPQAATQVRVQAQLVTNIILSAKLSKCLLYFQFIIPEICHAVVNAHTPNTMDYYSSRESFVNDGVDKLKKIKEHRDYIAHRKRFSLPSVVNFSFGEIAVTLDNIITAIEK